MGPGGVHPRLVEGVLSIGLGLEWGSFGGVSTCLFGLVRWHTNASFTTSLSLPLHLTLNHSSPWGSGR